MKDRQGGHTIQDVSRNLCVAKYKLRRRPGSQRGRCSVFASGMSQGLRLDGQERHRAELGDAGQSSVAAISVVVNFVAIELPFQIALVPKQSLIEVFPPDGPDQSLDKSVRTRCPGNRLDLINLKYSKVRQGRRVRWEPYRR